MPRFARSNPSTREFYHGRHRFEHWYCDNTIYFITARVRNRVPAFASEAAKDIFWDRFDHSCALHGFYPWVTTLLDNHYHTLGYLRRGTELGPMMRKIHGSVAKLTNDLLPERIGHFWSDRENRDYFDGCIRDEIQCRRAYFYTLMQAVRAGLVADWRQYRHTRVRIDLRRGINRALTLRAFLPQIPYPRYRRGERWSP